jgi:RNA polymerase sigma-70 factor (ECF subfamily)
MNEIDTIIKEYGRMVTAISFRMIENRDSAEDAAQEAWIEIIKSLPSFKGESKISTWIYTVATRSILKHSKNEQKNTAEFIIDYLNGPEIIYNENTSSVKEEEWTRALCDKCITGSIHCLSNEERLIYLLYDLAGLSSKEIASILNLNSSVIRKKMSRSREKLHCFLNNQCILYNLEGKCTCRIVKSVIRSDIPGQIEKIKRDIQDISFIRQCDEVLSNYNFFFDNLCHSYGFPPH